MIPVLISVHLFLCCLAIGLGAFTVRDLNLNRVSVPRMVWFLRCSLGSSFVVLPIQLHHLVPAQKVAMVAVYAAGVAVLGWRTFHLRGLWRDAFAFALAFLVYLNVLALSLQVLVFNATAFRFVQAVLFIAAVVLGVVSAKRFSLGARPAVVRTLIPHDPLAHR